METDINIYETITSWPRWKQVSLSIAVIVLLSYSIWYALFLNSVR